MFFSFVKSDKIILTKFLTLEKAASKVNKDAVFKTIKLQFIIYLLFASALSPNSFRSGPLNFSPAGLMTSSIIAAARYHGKKNIFYVMPVP